MSEICDGESYKKHPLFSLKEDSLEIFSGGSRGVPWNQTCQLSRIMRESHTFGVFLTLTRLEEVFSRILPFSVINIFIIMNHTYLIDVTPISTLINFNNYYKETFAAQ